MKAEPGQQRTNSKPQAQAILSFILVFIAAMVLVLGISRIWSWFNVNYASKSSSYERTRLHAGKPDTYQNEFIQENNFEITPLKLNEEWLFGGKVTNDNKINPFSGSGSRDLLELAKECQENCKKEDAACVLANGRFNILCSCYVKCMCLAKIDPYKISLEKQEANFRKQVNDMNSGAAAMRDAAEKCSKFWQLCWWFGFGKSAKELKRGARQMDRAARELLLKADEVKMRREGMVSCCELTTAKEQEGCMKFVADSCAETRDGLITTWERELYGKDIYENEGTFSCDAGDTAIEYKTEPGVYDEKDLCHGDRSYIGTPCATGSHDWSATGAYQEPCIYTCRICKIGYKGTVCHNENKTGYAIPFVRCLAKKSEKNTGLYAQKEDIEDSIIQIGPVLNNCANLAKQTCDDRCNYKDDCDPSCYENERNNCCKESFGNCGRQCDIPVTDCDQDCVGQDSCPQCGLSELKIRLQDKLDNEINPRISELEGKIRDLRDKDCCNGAVYPKAPDQLKCLQEEAEK